MGFRPILLALSFLLLVATRAGAAPPDNLELGFFDGEFASPDSIQRAAWLDDAVRSGGSTVRVQLDWRLVAPTRPAVASNPDDPAYRWASTTAAVRDASRRGLRVLLSIARAPVWAEAPGRPPSVQTGTWKPDPRALGDFARAAARRYPGVRFWQVWNEPNLAVHLSPPWTRKRGRHLPTAARHYRRLQNAVYDALKGVSPSNVVITAGTAPYGDPPGYSRVRPVSFWKEVLKRPTRFDVLAHHPYSVGGPLEHAISPRDVSVPDLGRLTRVLRSALRRGTALPRRVKPLWITEMSWDSNPPDPSGVPQEQHARWLSQMLYLLWKQGADLILWFQVRDQASTNGFDAGNQSGIFLRSGEPKPAQQAFSFPLACERLSRRRLRVWGIAPQGGTVELLRGTGVVIRRLGVRRRRVFVTTLRGPRAVSARIGFQTSRTCSPL